MEDAYTASKQNPVTRDQGWVQFMGIRIMDTWQLITGN
jgi:hypothetical protein